MNNQSNKHRVKTISAAVLSIALILTGSTQFAFAADKTTSAQELSVSPIVIKQTTDRVRLISETVTKSTAQLKTNLDVPIISVMKDQVYQNTLNANIAARAKAVVDSIAKQAADAYASRDASAEFWPFEVTVKFELISDGSAADDGILSFKILTYTFRGGAHGGTVAETYNIRNAAKASPVKLKDLFGSNYISIVNRAVKAEIATRPDEFDIFQSISDKQAFYIQDGIAYIIFQQYEITPFAAGMPEIALVIPGIGEDVPAGAVKFPVVADRQNVSVISLYTGPGGIVMAPLRPIAQALGYTISYDASTQQTKAIKGNDWAKITTGRDRYAFTNKATFTLGAAPVTKGGTLYVPMTYFAKVLHADLSFLNQAIVLSSTTTR